MPDNTVSMVDLIIKGSPTQNYRYVFQVKGITRTESGSFVFDAIENDQGFKIHTPVPEGQVVSLMTFNAGDPQAPAPSTGTVVEATDG